MALGVFHLGVPGGFRHHKLFCEFDPVLGWVKKAGHTGRHETGEYSVTESMNSKGLRGPEYPYEKPAGEFRVLFLGDSITEGYTVEFGQVFTEVMKSRLNGGASRRPDGRVYQAINAGTGGYSTDQELLFFEREGKKYSPALVVLVFCENDVWYNARPAYHRGDKPQFILNPEGKATFQNVRFPQAPPAPTASPAKTSWLKKFRVYNLFHEGMGQMRPDRRALPDEFRVWKKDYDSETMEAWKVTAALLDKLRETVSAEGSDLLVFFAPAWAVVQGIDFRGAGGFYQLASENYDADKVAGLLRAICEEKGIVYLDPTEEMRIIAKAEGSLFFKRDGHWNAKGHKAVGEILWRYVLQNQS